MKFLQIHVFYEQYLQIFYQNNPQLKTASYAQQIQALIGDGFSAGHIYAPYMGEFGYETELIIANNPYSQKQWAIEQGSLALAQEFLDIVCQQIETFKPDILHVGHPMPPFDSQLLNRLSWQPKLVTGWRAAPISKTTDWSRYDVILSSSTPCREQALQLGAKATEVFFPGIPSFIADAVEHQPQHWDVVFSGQWSQLHGRRNQYLQAIAKAPLGLGGEFSIGYFLSANPQTLPAGVSMHNQGSRWGLEMYRALKSGKIIINGAIDMAKGEGPNMRLFEATATGSFLLTESQYNLGQFFEIGKEIDVFTTQDEAIEKIYYYLKNPNEREAIARRGQERCLRDYSMQRRSNALETIIQKYLKPSSKTASTQPLHHHPQNSPQTPLKQDHLSQAFQDSLTKIIESPHNPENYRTLAAILQQQGKSESALRAYNQALACESNSPQPQAKSDGSLQPKPAQ